MKDLSKISKELFSKIRGRFSNVTIGDDQGNVTAEPELARFFEFKFNDSNVTVMVNESDGITIMHSSDIIENQTEILKDKWYGFLKELRSFSKKRMMNFSIRDITKSNLAKRDYKYLASKNAQDDTMNESTMYGTSKMSYQNIGNARLAIKHNNAVEDARRTSSIGAIYVESNDGERFKYPLKHLNGARAMARHVSEGGNPYDSFGKYIVGLSEELSKLKKFKTYMGRSSVMAESLKEYNDIIKDRIDSVKKETLKLQRESYYTEAAANFSETVLEDVPEDVSENWIDQLTIRQFNEELQDIFPYIYRLVSEATRAKDVDINNIEEAMGDPKGEINLPSFLKDFLESVLGVYWKGNGQGGKVGKSYVYSSGPSAGPGNTEAALKKNKYVTTMARSRDNIYGDISGPNMEDYRFEVNYSGPTSNQTQTWRFYDQNKNESAVETCEHCGCDPKNPDPNCTCEYDNHVKEAPVDKEKKTPISELILSHYDRETGSFPKGETAILTMIEKDYGDDFIEPAKQFIEKVNTIFDEHQMANNPQKLKTDDDINAILNLAGM